MQVSRKEVGGRRGVEEVPDVGPVDTSYLVHSDLGAEVG